MQWLSCFSAKAVSFNDVTIVYVKGSAYRIQFWYMSKDNAINITNNSNLIDKVCVLQFFLLYIKMSNATYYQRKRDVTLNRAMDYYENNKKKIKRASKR